MCIVGEKPTVTHGPQMLNGDSPEQITTRNYNFCLETRGLIKGQGRVKEGSRKVAAPNSSLSLSSLPSRFQKNTLRNTGDDTDLQAMPEPHSSFIPPACSPLTTSEPISPKLIKTCTFSTLQIQKNVHKQKSSSILSPSTITTPPQQLPQHQPAKSATVGDVGVWWIRNDLRVRDNDVLLEICEKCRGGVVGVVVLDDRDNERDVRRKQRRNARSREKEKAVMILREEVRRLGGEIVVRRGDVVEGVLGVVRDVGARVVMCEMGAEKVERDLERMVGKKLEGFGVGFERRWGGVMYGWEDVGGLEMLGDDVDEFGRLVEGTVIKGPRDAPEWIPGVALGRGFDIGCVEMEERANRRGGVGGEKRALELVEEFVSGGLVATLSGGSSVGVIDTKFGKLAPFLSLGCLSPRWLWREVQNRVPANSVRRFCVEFELVLRDFLRYSTLKHGMHPA